MSSVSSSSSSSPRLSPRRLGFAAALVASALLATFLAPGVGTASPADVRTVSDRGMPLRVELRDAFLQAKRDGVTPVVLFTASWCRPCKRLEALLTGDAQVASALKGARFFHVDVDEWRGQVGGAIAGASPTRVPLVVRVDAQGKALRQAFGSQLGLGSPAQAAQALAALVGGRP